MTIGDEQQFEMIVGENDGRDFCYLTLDFIITTKCHLGSDAGDDNDDRDDDDSDDDDGATRFEATTRHDASHD